jgi:sulfatase modifying factor 1
LPTGEVSGFEMDKTEVTVAAYKACVQAGKCAATSRAGGSFNWNRKGTDRHPINCVDWEQATA